MRSPVAEEGKVYLLVATAGARRACPPGPTRRCGKEDTFVEEATVTFTKHVKHRVSTLSEPEAPKIAEVGEDTDVEGLCHFAAIVPKDGKSRPFPIHLAAPPLYMCKARVHVCSRAIPGSNVPPTVPIDEVVKVVYKYKESKASHIVVVGPNGFQLCSCLQALRCGLPYRHTVAALVTKLKRAEEFKGESIHPRWRSSLQPWSRSIEGAGLSGFNGHERGPYSGGYWRSRRHRLSRRGRNQRKQSCGGICHWRKALGKHG